MEDRLKQVMDLIATLSKTELMTLQEKLDRSLNDEKISKKRSGFTPERKEIMPLQCPHCSSSILKGHGKYRDCQRYKCLVCTKTFNDMTNTPLSGVHSIQKMKGYVGSMVDGEVLRKAARKFNISLKTAFDWRHKILKSYFIAPSRKLTGIAEADETFFLYSEKGSKRVSKRRKPRKRGGKATTAGISDEHVPVILGCDRKEEMIIGVAGRGRISLNDIERVLGNHIENDATLCSDSHASFKAFAKAHNLKHEPVNISKGRRVVKKVFHIQNANSGHTRLKNWMIRFHGVATKYLDNYMNWFSLLEETKHFEDQDGQFAQILSFRREEKNDEI